MQNRQDGGKRFVYDAFRNMRRNRRLFMAVTTASVALWTGSSSMTRAISSTRRSHSPEFPIQVSNVSAAQFEASR